jgi:hypothetical protein
MIVIDFEVFRYDWILCFLDTKTRKEYSIVNDKSKLERFYEHYKNEIWIAYNGRGYDQWVAKAILCDFNPFLISDWIINQDKKGYQFSNLLNQFPILMYDCSYYFRSLKELAAFQGHSIIETSVPFDIDRKLTPTEIIDTIQYCKNDVIEAFNIFVETASEFESHIGLIKEFGLSIDNINKTKAQISAIILGASKKKRDDEFDIRLPDTLDIGKYIHVVDWYRNWASSAVDYTEMELEAEIAGVPHKFGIGGLHGSRDKYVDSGTFLLADVASYYPALMIEYGFLSRNVLNPKKYKQIRDDRLVMKKNKDSREYPRKIVLNSTFGAQKDQYNNLYDPLQANNICIAGQLFLVDLIDKLENHCQLIQSNTDGILIKLYRPEDKEKIFAIAKEWEKRTRLDLEFDEVTKVIQRDVNNYIIVFANGKVKRKGAVVKPLKKDSTKKQVILDNDLPIVNQAVVDYFVKNIPVETTILSCNEYIMFQKVVKVGGKYDNVQHNGKILNERVNRCFASLDSNDGTLFKKHKLKETLDKTPSSPINCYIDNGNILDKPIPTKLDKQWYVDLAKERIEHFI